MRLAHLNNNRLISSALLLMLFWLCIPNAHAMESIDRVLVIKSLYKLYLMHGDQAVRSYPVAFGAQPKGHKQKLGDERTPEGTYTLDYKNANSVAYKSIHISYPNAQDRQHAQQAGVDPGGDIMIHGQPNGLGWLGFITQHFNWTDGCIAVSNWAMDEIWNAVSEGTPIEIRP